MAGLCFSGASNKNRPNQFHTRMSGILIPKREGFQMLRTSTATFAVANLFLRTIGRAQASCLVADGGRKAESTFFMGYLLLRQSAAP